MNKGKVVFFIVAILSIAIAAIILFTNGKPGGVNSFGINNQNKIMLNIISKTGNTKGFFEEAAEEFTKKNPKIEINYIGKSTADAIDYINDDNDVDGWICADEAGADMLKDYYSKAHNGKDVVLATSPIVITPLVFVGWESRLNVLDKSNDPNDDITISKLFSTVTEGKSWKSVGGQASWGFINFSHTDPVKSNSGVQFISLLIHNFYSENNMPKKDLRVEDITNDKLPAYIKNFEKNTAKQTEGSGKSIESMLQYGPSTYDITANYEFYALSNLKNAQGRWGNLRIIYPNPTIWSNRPFVILNSAKTSKEKQEACKKFKEYLLSSEVQKKAIMEGYRPANTAVSDLSYLEKEYGRYGFQKDIPPVVPAPTAEVARSIQALVKRIQ